MNFTILKEKIKTAQLDHWLQDNMLEQLRSIFSEYSQKQCQRCTHGCPIAGANTCHTGCTLFAAVG